MGNKVSQEVLDKIIHAIESVRPYLISDGGDVTLVEVTDDLTVKVRLQGACYGCPFSEQTLRAGIEHAIRSEVPDIKELIALNE
ncbi:MAG: NifU family protein [Bacteroidales bacterium]|nr:NifU family protein [Bacteroidales bacterium]